MIIEVLRHGLVAISRSTAAARFEADGVIRSAWPAVPAKPRWQGHRTGVLVEILRRFGGHASRALVGAEFSYQQTEEVLVEVAMMASGDPAATCESVLWKGKPFTIGLPETFGTAVVDGLKSGAPLPSGSLSLASAGYDEVDSSSMAFSQAAAVLSTVIAAEANGRDVETDVRALISAW